MDDIIDLGTVFESVKADIPADATHVLFLIPSRKSAALFSLPDGMYKAECASKTAILGENPNKRESRLFLSHGHALGFVRQQATFLDQPGVIFEHDVESERMIMLPGGDASLVVNGSARLSGGSEIHTFNRSIQQ